MSLGVGVDLGDVGAGLLGDLGEPGRRVDDGAWCRPTGTRPRKPRPRSRGRGRPRAAPPRTTPRRGGRARRRPRRVNGPQASADSVAGARRTSGQCERRSEPWSSTRRSLPARGVEPVDVLGRQQELAAAADHPALQRRQRDVARGWGATRSTISRRWAYQPWTSSGLARNASTLASSSGRNRCPQPVGVAEGGQRRSRPRCRRR